MYVAKQGTTDKACKTQAVEQKPSRHVYMSKHVYHHLSWRLVSTRGSPRGQSHRGRQRPLILQTRMRKHADRAAYINAHIRTHNTCMHARLHVCIDAWRTHVRCFWYACTYAYTQECLYIRVYACTYACTVDMYTWIGADIHK